MATTYTDRTAPSTTTTVRTGGGSAGDLLTEDSFLILTEDSGNVLLDGIQDYGNRTSINTTLTARTSP